MGTRRAWVVWGVGVGVYLVAVLHRTSFGVAGLEAAGRFHTSAAVLATFTVLQLLVYAGLQIPVGVLIDRLGSRRLLVTGAWLMAAGQLLLALATTVGAALAARVLVGTGDALTFLSVLRLIPAWFPARRVPLMTQVTGLVGQLGQVLSAIPLVALLHGPGWTTAFGAAAGLGLLAGLLALAALQDAPGPAPRPRPAPSPARVGRDLVSAWRHPGTRLGLWTHFTSQFSGTVFALMWGFPFLVAGEGLSPGLASALLTGFVLVSMATGPVIGVLVARHPLRRSWLVLGITGFTVLMWAVVLAWPTRAPLGLLALLVLAIAVGGPGSMIGFDYARTFNPPNRLGTATGIVNVGGFVASLLTILLVGLILDLRSPPGATFGLPAFRMALSVQFLVWAVGVAGILRSRRLVRRRMAEEGLVVPPLRQALARERARRAQARPRPPGPPA